MTPPPRLPEDYESAAKRHRMDAQRLEALGRSRLPAADHHFGIAAECGIKYALNQSGCNPPLRLHGNGDVFKHHADKLWISAPTLPLDASRFSSLIALLAGPNPFDSAIWNIADRYAETVAIEHDISILNGAKARWELRRDATDDIFSKIGGSLQH